MPRSPLRTLRAWAGAAVVVLSALPALAYDQPIHELLSRRSYAGPSTIRTNLAADSTVVLVLRSALWSAGSTHPDAAIRRQFLQRFPTEAAFDAFELKRLLGLDPRKHVAGLDETPLPVGDRGADVYALASRLPDDDLRNQDRVRLGPDRQPLPPVSGQTPPDDPAILDWGDTRNQAHAHYQLPQLEFSDSPDVLKTDPRRFAKPTTVLSFGAELAESYTLLAAIAASLPGGERLALTHAGAAAHHLEDVANQIHTVQVGLYDFFFDAKLASIQEDLLTVGGLLGQRRGFIPIGIQIIANHHYLLEALFRKHALAAGDPVAARLSQPIAVDTTLAAAIARIPSGCSAGFGQALTMAVTERSSLEGPELYALIRAAADPRYSRAGVVFAPQDEPDAALRPLPELGRFYDLQLVGVGRADQALRAWWERYNRCTAGDARGLAERFIALRIGALAAADQRFRHWQPKTAQQQPISWWVPALYLACLAAAVGAVLLLRARRRPVASRTPSAV